MSETLPYTDGGGFDLGKSETHRLMAENTFTGSIGVIELGDEEYCERLFCEYVEKIRCGEIQMRPGDRIYVANVSKHLIRFGTHFSHEMLRRERSE